MSRFLQWSKNESSLHHAISWGELDDRSEVSKSSTFVSKEVERTMRTDPEVKHARNRPLGQKDIMVIGCARRWRQCTSVRVREAADKMTTEWSDVARYTEGRVDGPCCPERTARVV